MYQTKRRPLTQIEGTATHNPEIEASEKAGQERLDIIAS